MLEDEVVFQGLRYHFSSFSGALSFVWNRVPFKGSGGPVRKWFTDVLFHAVLSSFYPPEGCGGPVRTIRSGRGWRSTCPNEHLTRAFPASPGSV